eukprot:4265640-Amphidinium_carterae.1
MAQDAVHTLVAGLAVAPAASWRGVAEALISHGSVAAWTLVTLPGMLHDTWPVELDSNQSWPGSLVLAA